MKKRIDLAGEWTMRLDTGEELAGRLPGSNYLTLMNNGMEDPFFGTNEEWATEKGHHGCRFSRSFTLTKEDLAKEHLEFVADGIDTVCEVFINGKSAGKADNINRVWRFDIRPYALEGENRVELDIKDPYAYMLSEQKGDKHLQKSGQEKSFIRKTPCHFGWDWGPKLAPSGVTRSVALESYDVRIEEVFIRQEHPGGSVKLKLELRPDRMDGSLAAEARVGAPDGEAWEVALERRDGVFKGEFEVPEPRLWWVAGLGEQPLYTVNFTLTKDGAHADAARRRIGLRTLELDTNRDADGEQFRFVINGVKIFVRGADWIPSDSFITRFTRGDMEFYIKSVRDAGMNMLRVWGGGTYETEDFYDLCDRYGILVWQDFVFACALYPFYRDDFVSNVRAEVIDNVRRIRHRACLALWCGNNELDVFYPLSRDKELVEANKRFFYFTLKDWVSELDGVTPYWPGSPSSGHYDRYMQNFRKGKLSGDSHLWNIWHGMLPIEAYRDFPTRFCSEFGMESMPAMKTIRRMSPHKEPDLFDDVMLLHQKSAGGNSKIMYYLLQKYRRPKKFEDFVYLSQIVQSDAMRFATECWKRRIGKQNGATLWQLNDCWPVASWAIIDYYRQFKATMYHSRHYNRLLMISNDYYPDRSELYVINEYPKAFEGALRWEFRRFDGKTLSSGEEKVILGGVSSARVKALDYKNIPARGAYLKTTLWSEGELLDEKLYLPVPDKDAELPKAEITFSVEYKDGSAFVTLRSDVYARYVFVDSPLVWDNFSDNYFDLEPGSEKVISVPLKDVSPEDFASSLTVKSLTDVEPYGTPEDDRRYMRKMWRKDKNWLTYYGYKLLMTMLRFKSRKD